MDKITEIFRKPDLLSDLTPTLEQSGFSDKEDFVISFEYQGKVVKTEPITPVASNKSSVLKSQDLNTNVQDWLNKLEKQYELSPILKEQLGLPEQGEFDITVSLTSKSKTFAASGMLYHCPCSRYESGCCWK